MSHRQKIKNLTRSSGLFAGRMAGAAITFLVQAAMARYWGSAILADYLLLISAANIAGMMMPLGFQTVGSYFAVEYAAHGNRANLYRFVRRAYVQTGTSAVLLALVVWGMISLGVLDTSLAALVVPGLIFALAMASVFICGAVLVGLKHTCAGLLTDGLFRPLAVLSGFAVALQVGEGGNLNLMVQIMAGTYLIIALGCLIYTVKAVAAVPDDEAASPDQPQRWWRFAVPWVIITTSTEFFFDIDLLFLASTLDKTELAIFGVSARIFGLLAFGVAATYAVLLPDMMKADARKETDTFHRCLDDANLAAFTMSLVLLAITLVAGHWILALFGPAFEQGRWALSILCGILVVRTFFGPAELVLSLHDRPWAAMPAVLVGLGGLAAANMFLIPHHGLAGAAWAALIATFASGVVKWMTVRHLTGVDVSLPGRFQTRRAISIQAHTASGS